MSAQHGTSSNDDRFQAGEDRMSKNHFAGQRGFTLSEVAVASLIFLFVAVAAFKALTESSQVYKRGNESAEMQQRTRMAFDQMMTELRLAGFDYNRDGEENVYPDQPDEQLEWIGDRAIAFRGNLDYGDGASGREEAYEDNPADVDYGTVCCPIVTTANDEIVAYALRSTDASRNTGSIAFRVDLTVPRDGGLDDIHLHQLAIAAIPQEHRRAAAPNPVFKRRGHEKNQREERRTGVAHAVRDGDKPRQQQHARAHAEAVEQAGTYDVPLHCLHPCRCRRKPP